MNRISMCLLVAFATSTGCAADPEGAAPLLVCSPTAGDCGDDLAFTLAADHMAGAGLDVDDFETLTVSAGDSAALSEPDVAALDRTGLELESAMRKSCSFVVTEQQSSGGCCEWNDDLTYVKCWFWPYP